VSAPAARRSTSNANARGNTLERGIRRAWLVTTYGDGVEVLCFHCGTGLTSATVSCDRIRPGVLGGSYAQDNIRPACLDCNVSDGGKLGRARQLGRSVHPIKLTVAQHRVLIRVRCYPSARGFVHLGLRYRRTVEILGRLSLVNWWWGNDGAGTVLAVSPVNPLAHEGVTR
jgi:hypothetical protein